MSHTGLVGEAPLILVTGATGKVGNAVARRLADQGLPERHEQLRRGYGWLHAQHVTQADQGCDFDFARMDWEP